MALATVSPPSNPSPNPDDFAAKAHHNASGKGFNNPWPSFQDPGVVRILKWLFTDFTSAEVKPDTSNACPVRKASFLPSRVTSTLRATWLGHACFYVEFPSGARVLFDPVFTHRASPFSWIGYQRYTKVPCEVEDIKILDAVVLSHNHYDHMSLPTLKRIQAQHRNVHFFVPLGNKAFLERQGFGNVTELDWWEERELHIPLEKGSVTATLSCLPAQHLSARGPFDRARTLWSSWAVSSGSSKLWFAGDTGYKTVPTAPTHCPAFEQIGRLRGPFDLGLIPIGAYKPRELMSPVHADPFDAVEIFRDTKCRRALGMHWGTWCLTNEEVMEPPMLLKKALQGRGVAEGVFEICDIGESREY